MELSVRRKRLSLQPLIRILMFYILMTMFVGIGSGFLLRDIKATRHAGKAVTLAIWAMLFLMGMKIGADRELVSNISSIGLQSALLAIAGVTGSVTAATLLYKFMFRKKSRTKSDIQ